MPANLAAPGGLEVGCAVLVDFAHRPAVGYVVGLRESTPDDDLGKFKLISERLSPPYFDEVSARCAQWIAREYCAPLSDAIHLFAPPGGAPKLKRNETGDKDWELVEPGVGPVDDRWVRLTQVGRSYIPPKTAVKQQALIEALREGEMRVAELALEVGSVNATIKALEKRGIVSIESRRRIRGVPGELPSDVRIPKLTSGQQAALDAIDSAMDAACGRVVLCDGVTGSGKTEVYLRAISRVLEQGGGAIVLVPEISLTAQTVARFRGRFGDQVAVLHSRLSKGERFDQWDLLRSGGARVAIGARSALFAPVHDLRLVIIDEEHEGSYKQDSSPRYHARDVALHLMRERGGTLVLGSATPALETLANCQLRDDWQRVVLPSRVKEQPMPSITIVDMTQEPGGSHRELFSREMVRALLEVRDQGHKAVMFLNQRGYANFIMCQDCGYVPHCANCSTSLTYHERGGDGPSLHCHHCDAHSSAPVVCPRCGSPYLSRSGVGTQRVQDELAALLGPDMPIIRMDADSTRTKGAHEKLLSSFAAEDRAVLLGTQMIAKGLDYPDVTLVGVINADTSLYLPDFRAGERGYQLLEQVSGRAGRGDLPGRVIIQSYWPQHPAIQAVAKHSRNVFLSQEIPLRRELSYPPYSRLINILLWGAQASEVEQEAKQLAGRLLEALLADSRYADVKLLGPSPCVFSKLKGSYRWHILIKAAADSQVAALINSVLKTRKKNGQGVTLAVDMIMEHI